jgi:hypothetical protein
MNHDEQQQSDLPLDPDEERELAATDGVLGAPLRALLDPDGSLTDRTTLDVDRALRGRSALSTGFELLGLGWHTARTLLSEPAPPADQDAEGI